MDTFIVLFLLTIHQIVNRVYYKLQFAIWITIITDLNHSLYKQNKTKTHQLWVLHIVAYSNLRYFKRLINLGFLISTTENNIVNSPNSYRHHFLYGVHLMFFIQSYILSSFSRKVEHSTATMEIFMNLTSLNLFSLLLINFRIYLSFFNCTLVGKLKLDKLILSTMYLSENLSNFSLMFCIFAA